MFNESTITFLSEVGINVQEYWNDVFRRFGDNVKYIDLLCLELKPRSIEENRVWFNNFCEIYKIKAQGKLYSHLYDMSYALLGYCENGRLGYFKDRIVESYVPPIILVQTDIDDTEGIALLSNKTIIYRGMSKEEFDNQSFSQHWTTDRDIAERFAFSTYSNFPNHQRILVQARIMKKDVLYYDPNGENEIIPKSPVSEVILTPHIIK